MSISNGISHQIKTLNLKAQSLSKLTPGKHLTHQIFTKPQHHKRENHKNFGQRYCIFSFSSNNYFGYVLLAADTFVYERL